MRVSKRRSRLVRMPDELRADRDRHAADPVASPSASSASATGASGATVTGSTIMPDSERLTLSTSAAWAAIVMFLWTKPSPPSWASAIARCASVTVSIAAETIGIRSAILRVSRVVHVHLRGQHVRALRHQQHVVEGQRLGRLLFDIDPPYPWHFLYFLPLPQGQGSLRPTFGPSRRTVCTSSVPPFGLARLGLARRPTASRMGR